MKILVSGGAGFIGSNIVDRYVALGHEVAVLDNLATGRRDNLNPRCRFFEMGLLDDGLEAAVCGFGPDVISHHAAQVNVRRSVDDPVFDAQVNVLGSIRLYQAAVKSRCGKVIYASSGGACYGEPPRIPADEETRVLPLCPYGASKYAAEKYLELFSSLNGFRFTILRYANVYGPRQDPHGEAGVVAVFSELLLNGRVPQIFGDGSKTRDYVFVRDIVEANVLALAGGDGRVYNVGVGRQVSDDEVFRAIRDALGSKVEAVHTDFRKGEVRHIALDASRLRRELGWAPRVTFEKGIAETAAWYQESRAK